MFMNEDHKKDIARGLALGPPLVVRFYQDNPDIVLQRLTFLVMAFVLAYLWTALFKKQFGQSLQIAQLHFAMLFAILLPASVGLGTTALAISFGWVFGREIFGGRAILPPALIAVAFAIFSFPKGGFEVLWVVYTAPNVLLALSCLPGAVWLLWKKDLAWPVLIGALAGVALAVEFIGPSSSVPWWGHFVLGTFTVGVVFMAAAKDCAPHTMRAQMLYGLLIGSLVVSIRVTSPEQSDGVIFAILLSGLFAPLFDRLLNWGKGDA